LRKSNPGILAEALLPTTRDEAGREARVELLRNMMLARRLDEKMLILLKQGKSFFHIGSSGHEGAQVAAARCLRPAHDWAFPYYRELAFVIQWGMTPLENMLCFLARADDPNSGGRQMPQHYGHKGLQIVSQSSPTGTQFLQAVGCAMGCTRDGAEQVVYVSAGEGTTSQGDYHEALNWASRDRLPVIFHIQDNKFAISVPIHEQTSGGSVYDMAAGYEGLSRFEVDGTDIHASMRAFQEAVTRARAGEGPSVVVSDLVRLLLHSSSDDHRKYRSKGELEAERLRDPIPRWREILVNEGWMTEKEAEELAAEVRHIVDAAADEAEQRPHPTPSTATLHVYASTVYEPPAGASMTPASTDKNVVLVDAINHALSEEMERDPRILVFGQDVAGGKGGVFTATRSLTEKFGEDRCFNAPLAESSIVGVAIGLALRGLRPVPEIQFGDYIWTAMMQIRNELAMMRYRSNGAFHLPVVLRVPVGGYIHGAPYHSQNIEATFAHFPGLRICYPSNASDAKGLLKCAIRGEDPTLFLEHKGLYRQAYAASPEPDSDFLLPLGEATVHRPGKDMTIVTYGALVKRAHDASHLVEKEDGLSVEVIDLRTILPWDKELVLESVKRTNRVIVAHEDMLTGGFGGEVAAVIAQEGFEFLDAPVTRVAAKDTPVPYNWHLEAEVLPQTDDLVEAIRKLAGY
jgi:2-oxoisovalerate dehydrogenase E1 component